MRVSYDEEADVLMLILRDEAPVDAIEEPGGVIVILSCVQDRTIVKCSPEPKKGVADVKENQGAKRGSSVGDRSCPESENSR